MSCPYTLVESDLDMGIEIDYNSPKDVGSDRICNAVAGYTLYDPPLLIVDFGTATSFDVISRQGHYRGGVIAPGIEMSSQLLHQRAARLPSISLEFPDTVVGNTTVKSMQSGLMWGTVEMINGITRRIDKELGETTTKIATGGLAPVVVNELDVNYKLESHLTLKGLYYIYQNLNGK
ncbi:MAG: type III pantothenate kinase [candidate division KSB1 bacterium]|nr:type III pantothenate kinase [candidate division KSB1 bacterium]